MCYDISYTVKVKELSDYFPDLQFDSQLSLDFDSGVHIMGHSYGEHPIIYRTQEGKLLCRPMEWGCIPFYVKEEKSFLKQRASMLNARSERILEDSKSYWNKIKNRRCLIPVNGIYEHRAIRGWKKKVPYYITLKDQPMFFLPGLYSVADLPDTETGELLKRYTFTLITRAANPLMVNIHNDGENKNRMPLFLPKQMADKWIAVKAGSELSSQEYKDILNFEMPVEDMDYKPVFTIRSPKLRPDDKPKNELWAWENLPALGESNP